MRRRPTPALAVLFLIVAVAGGYQGASRYDGPGGGGDDVVGLVLYHGTPYVAGSRSDTDGRSSLAAFRYNSAAGVLLDSAFYRRDPRFWANGNALAVSSSGSVYVVGQATDADHEYFAVVKHDSLLNRLWDSGPRYDYAEALAVVTRGDTAYVTGFCGKEHDDWDEYKCLTARFGPQETSAGWSDDYQHAGGGDEEFDDRGSAIAVDNSGNTIVVGLSHDSVTGDDILIIKYNAAGNRQWVCRQNGLLAAGDDEATAVAVDDSGNVYVTGAAKGYDATTDYLTLRYSPSGILNWSRRTSGSASGDDVPKAVALGPDGYLYVTGFSANAATGNDFLTVKYNPRNGETL